MGDDPLSDESRETNCTMMKPIWFGVAVVVAGCVSGGDRDIEDSTLAGWPVRNVTEVDSGFRTVMFLRDSDSPVFTDYQAEIPYLVITCIDGGTVALVNWGGYAEFGDQGGDQVPISYTMDNQAAVQTEWTVTSSQDSTGVQVGPAEAFLRRLYQANPTRLTIELTTDTGEEIDASFDTTGVREVIDVVAERCDWSVAG
jgi:hypothetical protein